MTPSRRGFFRQILDNQRAHALLMNSLAVGEADSARDLDRIAEHVQDALLSRKVYRHFAEETKHARLFGKRMKELGFSIRPLPPELDYERNAQECGMGTPKTRLDDPTPFSTEELILFFSGSKAGEERACKEMEGLLDALQDDPGTLDVLQEIYTDEIRHVSYATEELQRLAHEGYAKQVVRTLRSARRAEARAHRRVSRAFMGRLMEILETPRWVRFFGALSIDVAFLRRFLFPGGLDEPRMRDAMPMPAGGRAPSRTREARTPVADSPEEAS